MLAFYLILIIITENLTLIYVFSKLAYSEFTPDRICSNSSMGDSSLVFLYLSDYDVFNTLKLN